MGRRRGGRGEGDKIDCGGRMYARICEKGIESTYLDGWVM